MDSIMSREELIRAMSSGKPVKSYIKTILGKVYVTVWNIFEGKPEGQILEGDPRKKEDGTFIELYSDYEVSFFKKANKKHLDAGFLVEYLPQVDAVREKTIEEYNDDELKELLNKPFLALQNALNKTQSVALLFRLENLAMDLDKSEKFIAAIRSRQSEVQDEQSPDMPSGLEKEL